MKKITEAQDRRVIVVGGGPAGMMAAIRAAQQGAPVILLERNPGLGRKLLLTGKGRCNLTNACDLKSFLERISPQGQFLRDAFKVFFNEELMRFFTERGVPVKVERQERVFPVSDRSSSILGALKNELTRQGVRVVSGAEVRVLIRSARGVEGVILADGQKLPAARVIWATGGQAYPRTGSDGTGAVLPRQWGHQVVALRPGLVPLVTRQALPAAVAGLSLKNIRLRFGAGKKVLCSEIGGLLFTPNGISGPLVLSLSGWVVDRLAEGQTVWVEIDLKPALSIEQLEQRLLREAAQHTRQAIRTVMRGYLPQSLVDPFLAEAGIPVDKKASALADAERTRIASLLKGLRLDITGNQGFDEAMVTLGGVSLKEINPRTMASRLIPGLYFAGEVLDLAGDTGGFNLQVAFSTGFLAGQSAAQSDP